MLINSDMTLYHKVLDTETRLEKWERYYIEKTITSQSELNGVEFYNITAISNNTFGNNQHIHLGGK